MTFPRPLLFVNLALIVAGCNGPAPEVEAAGGTGQAAYLTAATLGQQVVLPTADYLQLPRYRNADPQYGSDLAMQCRACHSFDAGGAGPLGPNLYGLFGRPAGAIDGYPYSPALAGASFYWTPRALDAWLAQPARFLPGNSMAYAGLRNPEDRDALIAALLRLTEAPDTAEGG
jgi:cytochrome c